MEDVTLTVNDPWFTFSFVSENGAVLNFQSQAPTHQEAADKLAKMFEQLMIQLRMQFPQVANEKEIRPIQGGNN